MTPILEPHWEFSRRASSSPHRVCVTGYRSGLNASISLTASELEDLARRVASGLRSLDCGRGDIVSVQLPNWHEFMAIYLACCHLGAILNPISPVFRAREVGEIISRLGSKVMVTATEFRGFDYEGMFKQILPETGSAPLLFAVGPEPGEGSFYEGLLEDESPDWDRQTDQAAGPDDASEVQFTSGTTGRPKAVVHSRRTVFYGMAGFPLSVGLTPSDVVHMPSSFGHQTGFLFGCVMPLAYDMKVVLQDRWDPRKMLELAKDEGITVTSGATPFILDICDAAGTDGSPPSLRWVRSGGAPIPEALARKVHSELGATLITSWGMTENGICSISAPTDSVDEVSSTDGRMVPWTEIRVVSDDGTPLEPGSQGQILVKGPSQCLGYLEDDGRVIPSADEAGWFDTGDVGTVSEMGYLKIKGRRKDLIIRGGENIPVVELEAAISRHPSVGDIALVGIPDERLGETACAVIVPEEGKTAPSLGEVCSWLEALGFSTHYWPESIVIVSALPTTSSGKIRRGELKKDLMRSSMVERRGAAQSGD